MMKYFLFQYGKTLTVREEGTYNVVEALFNFD